MKKFFKILGILVVVSALLFGAVLFWAVSKTNEVKAEATPFIEESIPLISTWEVSKFEHLLSTKGRTTINNKEGQKVLKYLSKIGGLKSFKPPVFIKSTSSIKTSNRSREIAIFTVEAEFENGVGIFTFVLSKADSKYKIDSINFNSNALFDM